MSTLQVSIRKRGPSTEMYLTRLQQLKLLPIIKKYGDAGVKALSAATPVATGLTASLWSYRLIELGRDRVRLSFLNGNEEYGANVAILIQYGHGTKTGGYVEGRDFINPAIQPVFDDLATNIFEEVQRT